MGDASFAVTNFTGGELCQYVQGNFTEPVYKTGLNLCSNALPVEEGAWVRRPGTQFAGLTRRGVQGRVIGFDVVASAPYDIELTPNFLRIWKGQQLALAEPAVAVTSISGASPAVLVPGSARTWNTGDTVQLFISPVDANYLLAAYVANRQFVVTKIDTTHFSLADQLGTPLDGSKFALGTSTVTVAKVLEFATPWPDVSTIDNIRVAQSENIVLMFAPGIAVQQLEQVIAGFTFAPASFLDGPYLDPPKDGSSVRASGTSGSVTLSFFDSGGSALNMGFTASNIGQFVRLLTEPPKWVAGTSYNPGDKTRYNGVYFNCIASTGTTNPPDTTPASQAVCPSAAQWVYALVTAAPSNSTLTVTLKFIPQPPPPSIVVSLNGPLLYTHDSGNPITTYRMGLYWGTTWPQCGTFHEGRFWFAGAVNNRADAAMANNGLVCSPTFYDGTPADDCGVSAVFNFPEVMQINAMIPNHVGIVCLCRSGEVLVQSSQLSDPITPTSIQAHLTTRYGSERIEPLSVGYSTLFVNRYGKKLYDLAPNFFNAQRISAINVSLTGRHLTQPGLLEIRTQRELAPLIWARASNGMGNWIGMTYKREDGYGASGPVFNGWHRHIHGAGNRYPVSLAGGTVQGGATDTLCMVTTGTGASNSDYNIGHVEFLTGIFQEGQSGLCAWQLDDAIVPVSANVVASGGVSTGVQFYGLWHLIGRTVSAYLGGLDCGDYTVAADGSVTVPFGACGGLFTLAYYQSLSAATCNLATIAYTVPSPANQGDNTIQAFGTVAAPVNGDWALADWTNRRFYAPYITGVIEYNMDTGAIIANKTGSGMGVLGVGFEGALDASGNIYFQSGANNVDIINKVAPGLTLTTTFGVQGGGFGDPTTQWPNPTGHGNLTCVKSDANYLITSTSGSGGTYVLNADTMKFAGYSNIGVSGLLSQGDGLGVAGPQSDNLASVFFADYPHVTSGTTHTNIYRMNIAKGAAGYVPSTWPTANSFITTASIGTVQATDIDAAWTHISSGVTTLLYDATDGHLIIVVSTSDAVTHVAYIAKINSATAAVIWKTALPYAFAVSVGNSTGANTSIKYGLLALKDGFSGNIYCYDTTTGALSTTVALTGLDTHGDLASNDTTGDVLVYGSYTQAGGNVDPIGGTPSTYSNLWGRLDVAGGVAVGQHSRTSTFTAPGVIGFRYTSKGQLLRQQSPETSGARNGPAMGKTRRTHRASAYFVNAISGDVSFGTDFVTLYPQNLSANGESRTVLQPFTGISRLELADDYSFDSMIAWQTNSAYPCTIAAVEGFLETQDL